MQCVLRSPEEVLDHMLRLACRKESLRDEDHVVLVLVLSVSKHWNEARVKEERDDIDGKGLAGPGLAVFDLDLDEVDGVEELLRSPEDLKGEALNVDPEGNATLVRGLKLIVEPHHTHRGFNPCQRRVEGPSDRVRTT